MNENSSSPQTCPKCHQPLENDAPQGLCPHCLLANVAFVTEDETLKMPKTGAPSLETVAAAFSELEVLEVIGRGGMGVVYKARQRSLGRLVALKLLAPELVQAAGFAERFATEARALATLSHPNIVTIHDFGESGGFYFLLMEFVDGVNLRQAMSAGRFTPEQALAIVPPVCEALQYAHDHGIVHRDIKPENLLLDKDGRVKIADFGIAKMLGSNADTPVREGDMVRTGMSALHSAALGTPRYAAPEQMTDPRHVDHRADIYSLGVVLYELLTGEAPGAKLTPPSQRVQIDVRLDEVVLRALNAKPELRWQTASDLNAEVTRVARSTAPADEETAARAWLATMDRGEYGDAWQTAHASFQQAVTSRVWTDKGVAIRTPLGGVVSRELSADSKPSVSGRVATVKFNTHFDGMSETNETVTLAKDDTGTWRATSYLILPAGSVASRVGSLGRMGFHSVWAWRLFVIGMGLCVLSLLRFIPGLEALQSLRLGALLVVPSLLIETICRLRFYSPASSPKSSANWRMALLPFACLALGWWMEVMRIDELKRLPAETSRVLLLGRFWLDGILIVGGACLGSEFIRRDLRAKMNLGSFGRFLCVITVVIGAFLALAWAKDAPIAPSDFEAGVPRKTEWPKSWTDWGWRIHLYFLMRAICFGLPGIYVLSVLREAWGRKRLERRHRHRKRTWGLERTIRSRDRFPPSCRLSGQQETVLPLEVHEPASLPDHTLDARAPVARRRHGGEAGAQRPVRSLL